MTINYKTDGLQAMIDEMQRVATTTPDAPAQARLAESMSQQFAMAQATVSVRTGALKASGLVSSQMQSETEWHGEIGYGNERAYYAAMHFAKEGQDPFTQPEFQDHLQELDNTILDAPHLKSGPK